MLLEVRICLLQWDNLFVTVLILHVLTFLLLILPEFYGPLPCLFSCKHPRAPCSSLTECIGKFSQLITLSAYSTRVRISELTRLEETTSYAGWSQSKFLVLITSHGAIAPPRQHSAVLHHSLLYSPPLSSGLHSRLSHHHPLISHFLCTS